MAEVKEKIQWFEIESRWLEEGNHRLDSSFYCLDVSTRSHSVLERWEKKIKTLNDFVDEIFYPPRLKRIWENSRHGEALFSSSQILEAYPETDTYISSKRTPYLESYRVKKNQILITRSGKVGNLVLVGKRLDGKLVTEDAIRLTAKENVPIGYVYTFLKSEIGRPLIKQAIFGAPVDHLQPHHLATIKIPALDKPDMKKVDAMIMKATSLRDEANDLVVSSEALFYEALHLPPLSTGIANYFGSPGRKVWEVDESRFNFEHRLDSNFYDPIAEQAVSAMRRSDFSVTALANVEYFENVFIPGGFKRTYAEDEHGIPLLSGKDIVEADPQDLKRLASSQTKNLNEYLIREGWVLVTVSGTIGRVGLVTKDWDGWAANQHVLRIVPRRINSGYLYSFLRSDYGQAQIKRFTHGSTSLDVTDDQIKKITIPIPSERTQRDIGDDVIKAFKLRAEANQIEKEAITILGITIHWGSRHLIMNYLPSKEEVSQA